MQAQAGGYVHVPEGTRPRHRESDAPSIRGMALVVALTLGLVGAFSALSLTSSGDVREPSTRHSYVVGGELVQPPAPSEPSIADSLVVDHTRPPGRPGEPRAGRRCSSPPPGAAPGQARRL